eukprot:CAMPEP_0184708492 /NCGR_PEP_ID=MMETSP0313-20130426/37794_1 /TAXON_ID=2792 /ORGANISM="Porphyridium aerugineum, Strain SAG 1380-2" /LENGTH=397 /DNA_ID=CAMNT_0027170085 /DNA_START=949 /DNA_END=2142 /DNA_ORIENTATION=+
MDEQVVPGFDDFVVPTAITAVTQAPIMANTTTSIISAPVQPQKLYYQQQPVVVAIPQPMQQQKKRKFEDVAIAQSQMVMPLSAVPHIPAKNVELVQMQPAYSAVAFHHGILDQTVPGMDVHHMHPQASQQHHQMFMPQQLQQLQKPVQLQGKVTLPGYATPAVASIDYYDHPDNEIRKKPRWETPRRKGTWAEKWECAKEMGTTPISAREAKITSWTVRNILSRVIVMNVGLAKATVDKWLKLLAEFLELNVDEHLILLCLVQKFLAAGNTLRSDSDYQRPQRWECIIGIACYFAVMLSEEFPGRTALDLRDLLGGSFSFGKEQIAFLKAVNWRVNVSEEEFNSAKELMADYIQTDAISDSKIMSWLNVNTSRPVSMMPYAMVSGVPTSGYEVPLMH